MNNERHEVKPVFLHSPETSKQDEFADFIAQRAGLTNFDLIRAIKDIDRAMFVPTNLGKYAYEDTPVPLLEAPFDKISTISQPSLVARMINALELDKSKNVLEIGTGSGYSSALMSSISRYVTTIEIMPELVHSANQKLAELQIKNVTVVHADGAKGYSSGGPYDAIVATVGMKQIPDELTSQLSERGKILVPEGDDIDKLTLTLGEKINGHIETINLGIVTFVPLVSGFKDTGWSIDEANTLLVEKKPERTDHEKHLEKIAQELNFTPDEYRALIRQVFGHKQSMDMETINGLSVWISSLRYGLPREDLIGDF